MQPIDIRLIMTLAVIMTILAVMLVVATKGELGFPPGEMTGIDDSSKVIASVEQGLVLFLLICRALLASKILDGLGAPDMLNCDWMVVLVLD